MKYLQLKSKMQIVNLENARGERVPHVKLYEEIDPHSGALITHYQELSVFQANLDHGSADIDIDLPDASGHSIRHKYPEKMLKAWGLLK